MNLLFSAGASWLPPTASVDWNCAVRTRWIPRPGAKYPQPGVRRCVDHPRRPRHHRLLPDGTHSTGCVPQQGSTTRPFGSDRREHSAVLVASPSRVRHGDGGPCAAGNARPRTPTAHPEPPSLRRHALPRPPPAHRLLAGRMTLGRVPRTGNNLYRCGEKVLLTDPAPGNLHIEVGDRYRRRPARRRDPVQVSRLTPRIRLPTRILRGDHPEDQRLLIGRTDGTNWRELVSTDLPRSADGRYHPRSHSERHTTVSPRGRRGRSDHDDLFTAGQVGPEWSTLRPRSATCSTRRSSTDADFSRWGIPGLHGADQRRPADGPCRQKRADASVCHGRSTPARTRSPPL